MGPSLSSLTGSSLDPVDSAFSQAAAYTSRFQQQHQQQQQQAPHSQQQQQQQLQQPPSLLDGGNTALGGTGVAAATRSVERYMSYLSGRSSRRPNLAANPNPLLIPAASSGAFAGSNISPTSEPEANAFRRHRSRRRAIQEDRMALGGSSRMHMLHTRSGALQGTASPGEGGSGGSIVGMGMGHGASGAVSENEGAMMMLGGGGGGSGGRMAGYGHGGAYRMARTPSSNSIDGGSSPEHPFISARAKASLGLMHRRAADSAIAFRRSGAGSEDADTPQGSLSSINSEGHLSDSLEQRTATTAAAAVGVAAAAAAGAGGEGGDGAGQVERREGDEAEAGGQTGGEALEGLGRSAVLERVREVGSGAVSNSLERVVEELSMEGREEEGETTREDVGAGAGAGAGARQGEGGSSARRGVEEGGAERGEGEGSMGTSGGGREGIQGSEGRESGGAGASEGERRGGGGGGGEGGGESEAERGGDAGDSGHDRGTDEHENREARAVQRGGREKEDAGEGERERGGDEGREGGTGGGSEGAGGGDEGNEGGVAGRGASHVGGMGAGAVVGGARAGAGGGWVGPGAAAGVVQQLSLLPQQEWTIEFSELRLGIRVGVGSFGEVFRAVWRGTEVAVKMLWEQDAKPEDTEDFYNEIALLSRLRHPNVILFMGACTVPPHLSMVTEYMHMGSLYRIIHTREPGQGGDSLSWKRRYKMLRDICRGMLCLQRMSIIHRDLKSANCLVDRHWCVKVCDFGLSRIATNGHVVGRTAAGTPEWMAPELLRNERCSFKCDVFSLGVIMWELATLRRPWEDCNGPLEVAYAVAHHNSRLPVPSTSLGRLISDCWKEDPDQRPDYEEILERLHECEYMDS
ncbi:unnamed protein product [Closterium sp. Yama58-4]|nr:unnamed protein product [Closterium sp. Yama58-4]